MTHTEAFALTSEQLDILTAARETTSNIMISALAGCGKTTTLEMVESAAPQTPCLYLAFNRKIANDAEKRMASTTQVRTFNGLGHRIWAKTTGKVKFDPKKTGDTLRAMIGEAPKNQQRQLWKEFWAISSAITWAKTVGYIPPAHQMSNKSLVDWAGLVAELDEEPSEEVAWMVDALLLRSIKQSFDGLIDYNDQIYMSALFGGVFPQFPLVMVDEYQDLNPLNHVMIKKLMKTSRLIGVGDPNQNIYGFRGAALAGMEAATAEYSMTQLPLSISFRCPERVVKNVHWHVPSFKWLHPGGRVEELKRISLTDFPDGCAIICRNNAPLFALAMRFLCASISVTVHGSDIGPRIINLMKKFGDEGMSREQVQGRIEEWLAHALEKGSKSAEDTAACMRVFAEYGANLGQAMAYAKHLFEQQGSITLLTGHKSKGLEFSSVYHLDPWLIGDSPQEKNLRYVIATRAIQNYFEIDSRRVG